MTPSSGEEFCEQDRPVEVVQPALHPVHGYAHMYIVQLLWFGAFSFPTHSYGLVVGLCLVQSSSFING